MNKKRYKEKEIKKILQEYKEGASIPQITGKYHISQATFYNWKAKFERNMSYDLYNIEKLKEENEHLKRMFVDLTLENISLKERLENKQSQ